jgi:transcriptional regulator with XRE-family HTH domain
MIVSPKLKNFEFKLLLAKRGLSQREFAKGISISHCYLSQIINGKRKPSPKLAGRIASGLKMGIEDIFFIQGGNKR